MGNVETVNVEKYRFSAGTVFWSRNPLINYLRIDKEINILSLCLGLAILLSYSRTALRRVCRISHSPTVRIQLIYEAFDDPQLPSISSHGEVVNGESLAT
jgi:hypothetical protein